MTFANGKWHELWSAICKNFYSKAQTDSRILKFEDLTGTTSATLSNWYYVDVTPSVDISRVKTVAIYGSQYPAIANIIPSTSKIRLYSNTTGVSVTVRVGYI